MLRESVATASQSALDRVKEEISVECSIVIPVYFNEGLLAKTFSRVREELVQGQLVSSFEIVFVDDGSQDGSFAELMEIKRQSDIPVRIVKLTRNFGQVAAINAGYHFARGECIVSMSADLQDPPNLISAMLRSHLEEGYEVVICARVGREESWYRRITSKLFYLAMKRLSFPTMPEGGFDFVLISKKVKTTLMSAHETNPFWQGQILWTGYKPKIIPYTRLNRELGQSR
jgi:polyisoprenyl-phosphate glycosyltransferase